MPRTPSPLILSAIVLMVVLAAVALTTWVVAALGKDLGAVAVSLLATTSPDEVIPRLAILALFSWGVGRLTDSSRNRETAAAAACAAVGVAAGLYLIVRTEAAFAAVFPDGGSAGGWGPGEARATFLPLPYLSALVQIAMGLAASTLLLALGRFRRRRA